jgi:hypothetical protein
MAESSKSKSGGGCLGKLFFLILLAGGCAFGAAVFFIIQPQDLTDIGGYGPAAKKTSSRDLKAVLETALKRGYPVTLTETEINQWIGQTLAVKQGGFLAGQVSLERVWVRLNDGYAEVVMERMFMGRPFTVSMFLKVEQLQAVGSVRTEIHRHGGQYHEAVTKPLRGGRFGKLVVPQGFLLLVLPAYEKLAEAYRQEIHLAFEEMARIRVEPKRLVLESRDPTAGGSTGRAQTF